MKEFVAELQNKYSNEHVVLANFSDLEQSEKRLAPDSLHPGKKYRSKLKSYS